MTLQQRLRRFVGDRVRSSPGLYNLAKGLENRFERYRHSVATTLPNTIKPRPYKIMIAVTAQCNARCHGCRYGRDFMVGEQLSLRMVEGVLEDAAAAGYYSIRLYGGEPLLHSDLPQMVRRCIELGMRPYVTTNGALLEHKIDALFGAGLRDLTFGFYGVGTAYDDYTQCPGLFERVERGIALTRERYGSRVDMQMNWLLMQPTASLAALHDAVVFAERYGMAIRVDLVHYSLPYFQEGEDRWLQFGPEDRPRIEKIVDRLVQLKREKPALLNHTIPGLRSIPDWLIKGPNMKVPCTAYEMVWIGADGTVQMCYVTFKLGNLHEKRFRDIIFTEGHRCAARDAFQLNCPNCHCSSNERVMRHAPSLRKYSRETNGDPR